MTQNRTDAELLALEDDKKTFNVNGTTSDVDLFITADVKVESQSNFNLQVILVNYSIFFAPFLTF